MPEIEHNGPGFRYMLNIEKDGKSNSSYIYDWKETVRELDMGLIYEPYDIYVKAENNEGMCKEPAIIHIGYTGEAGMYAQFASHFKHSWK